MAEPTLKRVQCLGPAGLHKMAYWQWEHTGGLANPPTLVCVHGLSRQGLDFAALAQAMSDRYRVIAPDVAGRGRSDWLANPAGYQIPAYMADMVTLLARLDAIEVDWVGTSMGGLIGMGLASLPGSPIRRLVLNDVGPAIRCEAIQRIGTYLGQPIRFDSIEQGTEYLWTISKSFGPHTAEEWAALSAPMFRPDGDGKFLLHYDPSMALPFKAVTAEIAAAGEAAMWKAYDAITCPTLLLRGAESDLLTVDTAAAMTQRGPRARLHELPGVGHAPTLVHADQITVVREFLGGA
ncbi:alpha/beta hydrolase [Paucibacter sp. R3-3]|uniref:Alpha/beta hydrolase n=1 Tax=Roseateles agri TaxID=3098619 RepID=A0ABU5DIB7_9BURK|nr:alpha/beta hydrolase [Paucibacter sp. R3-3]MDY0746027.1 alpha/beta hydrolase [Paucibacter sp. R3-3]